MTNNDLQGLLWAAYNEGRMPIAIRMPYPIYMHLMATDADFYTVVELGPEHSTYQGLKLIFDNEVKEVTIETDPPKAEPETKPKGVWK